MFRIHALIVAAVTVVAVLQGAPAAHAAAYWLFLEQPAGWRPGAPVPEEPIDAIAGTGAGIRTVSRYFYAVSVEWNGPGEQLASINGVHEVRPVKAVGGFSASAVASKPAEPAAPQSGSSDHLLGYGYSFSQLNILNVPALHDRMLTGEGVVIGVLDAGFVTEGIPCLEDVNVAATRNFIIGGDRVDNGGLAGNQHGTQVLACLAGRQPGLYFGTAFGATYVLALTEDASVESYTEEDHWVAGVEWCDSLGVDIISSSLVYNEFRDQYGNYDWVHSYTLEDMDGKTSLVARAAEIAWSHGILMVNAAGNEGGNYWNIVATPADAEHVLSVGAFWIPNEGGPLEILASSSRGPTSDGRLKPDVAAPGGFVYVPDIDIPAFGYTMGTSFSTPLVSGLCALLMEAHPDWSNADVFAAVTHTAVDLGSYGPDNVYGWGAPDALAAYEFNPPSVAVRDDEAGNAAVPAAFSLGRPYPNPFNAEVTIPFTLSCPLAVTVDVFDITGHAVAHLLDESLPAGNHEAFWRAAAYSSGIYIVRVQGGGSAQSARTVMVK